MPDRDPTTVQGRRTVQLGTNLVQNCSSLPKHQDKHIDMTFNQNIMHPSREILKCLCQQPVSDHDGSEAKAGNKRLGTNRT
jgi:hypothetical protein